MQRFLDWFHNLYPVWLVSLAVIAFFWPHTLLCFTGPWIFGTLTGWLVATVLRLDPAMPLASYCKCRTAPRQP